MMKFDYVFVPALWLLAAVNAFAFSSSDEKVGKEAYDQITGQIAIYADPKLTDYVTALGQKLVAHSDMPDEKFTFTVLDSPDINAFATPGGYIYVNRGLIGYLSSEAQLAAVMAHEVAHVTKKHSARQKRAQTTSTVAATVLAILSRSGEVGEATAMWGAASVRGYGRDMELEADAVGANYMAAAGYDRSAVIDVITLLKDNERFERKKARETGSEPQTYHGLFSTHPRNDKRLQEMVNAGGENSGTGEIGAIPFRLATNGLVWGENFQAKLERDYRLLDQQRLFRVDFPPDWQFNQDSSGAITASGPDGDGTMTIELERRTLQTPDVFIKDKLGISTIRKSQAFKQYGLAGHTGLTPDESRNSRIAVIYYRTYAVVFRGETGEKADDETLLRIIHSFAPVSNRQLSYMEPKRIQYVKATDNTTFAALAAHLNLGQFGEETLRLINGYYPRGEPETGEWIKIIR